MKFRLRCFTKFCSLESEIYSSAAFLQNRRRVLQLELTAGAIKFMQKLAWEIIFLKSNVFILETRMVRKKIIIENKSKPKSIT